MNSAVSALTFLRNRVITFVLIGFVVSLSAAMAQNASYAPDPSWQAPPQAVAHANPLAGKPDAAGGGRKLFLRDCAECHGKEGQGLKNAADLQLPLVQSQPDGALFWKITNGNPRRGMPSFSGLPEMQRWQLVLYLRQLSKPQDK